MSRAGNVDEMRRVYGHYEFPRRSARRPPRPSRSLYVRACRFLALLLKGEEEKPVKLGGVKINRECHGDKAAESIIPRQNRSPN